MATATIKTAPAPASVDLQTAPAEGIVLHDVSWEFYERLLEEVEGKNRVRLSYDDGELEIMAAMQFFHENTKRLIGRMIETLTEEFALPLRSAGSLTLKKPFKRKGLEPDECWYIEHESAVRGKRRVNLESDPPPDLALEVDDPSSSLDRLAIYAALRVPEVWRFQIDRLTINVLGGDEYATVDESPHFPGIPLHDLNRFLRQSTSVEENEWIRGFREWLRETLTRIKQPGPKA
jgi:Uma2 family endonuclease